MRRILVILLITFPVLLYGQIKSIGVPEIQNYPKSVYEAGTQNWDIIQDKNGFMYFANNEGVLIFDGLHWQLVNVSKAKPIRSVFRDSNNRIFVGLLNDFGFLQQNDTTMYSFISLRDLLPSWVEEFDEVWKIYKIEEGLVFQTFEYLFILNDNQINVIEPENRFHFAFNVNGKLFLDDNEVGVFEYKNNSLSKTNWSDELKEAEIWEILQYKDDGLLICTSGSGIFTYINDSLEQWKVPVNSLIQENKLYSAKRIKDNFYAFGTILNGLIISDSFGNIVQHINRKNGLQNNTVLSLYEDNSHNLWLGLDNGIDYIRVNSPISFFTGFDGLGSGYCSRIFHAKLYLGTNQGLFVKDLDGIPQANEKFRLVKNTAGQVWSLHIFDEQLICGQHSGTFIIRNEIAQKISNEEGAWKFIQLDNNPEYLLGGHYYGLVLFKKVNNQWSYYKKIKAFNESCRFLEQGKEGDIWVSHGAKGVYRINLSESLDSVTNYQLFNAENGLPSNEQNIVFRLGQDIIVSTLDGIYAYDYKDNSFKKSEKYMKIFKTNSRLKTFEVDESGDIWYIAQNETGVLRLNADSSYTKIHKPFNQITGKFVNEFEFIYPYDDINVITGLDNGFAHYSSNLPKSYASSFKSFITKVELMYIDSVISFHQIIDPDKEFIFPFNKNSFRFHYTSPFFEDIEKLEFSFYLEGFSETWSDWSNISFKDFTNLHEGNYSFKLKAKNVYGVESIASSFNFTITPPLHRSVIAYYGYVIISLFLLFVIIRFVHIQVKKSKERERMKHQSELQKREEEFHRQSIISEKEIIRLRNEKLRADMVHRDKELANQTMNIIQKNKLLSKLKEELDLMQKSTGDPNLKTKMIILNRRINKEIDNKQQNQVFKTYFEEVHEKFFDRLREIHPDLSPRELHLCAYVRMNLTTKEIAALQNITSRGVEIGRYRLRKKLKLSRETNLSTYLSNI